jgi:hypothetical protein
MIENVWRGKGNAGQYGCPAHTFGGGFFIHQPLAIFIF